MSELAEVAHACPDSRDGTHCAHWWDDPEPCCYCQDNSGWIDDEAPPLPADAG